MKTLTNVRDEIDKIDAEIQGLLTKRANLALDAKKIKLREGRDIHCPDREEIILKAIVNRNQGPLNNNQLIQIFETIIAACRSIQQK